MTTRDRLLVLPLATGFGVGYLPKISGTAGTGLGVALYGGLLLLPAGLLYPALGLLALAGVWLCGRAARLLGRADPREVVWDEIVGYCVAVAFVPPTLGWLLAGFVLFRMLDISKFGPVGWAERNFSGGLGIMADDLVAGALSALLLAGAHGLLGRLAAPMG